MQLGAAEMFFFVPIPTRAKNAWPSSTCLLYEGTDTTCDTQCIFLSQQISTKFKILVTRTS